jgi:glycosyltransferase involved in cell wall biosynthesis
MIKLLLDTSPLKNANAHRGVGQYTKLLAAELEKLPDLTLLYPDKLTGAPIKPDIVHYPFFDLFFPTLPLWRNAKTIVTIHDTIPLLYPQYYQPGKRGTLALWRQKAALKTVSAVITDSAASAADITKYLKVPAQKITVVPLAANPELQPAKPKAQELARERWHLPEQFVLYVGDINYNKNIPQLIKMVKFLPESVHLVCVGKNFYPHDVPEWRWIEAQLALSDVVNRVQFITDVKPDETEMLAALYSTCEVYVQPSLAEGFGLPLLEALQCGALVVANKTPALEEIGSDIVNFVDHEGEALAAGVIEMLELSGVKKKTLSTAGKAWAEKFSWEQVAAATAKVYQNVRHQP